ncbi:MAG: acyl-CoA/acyl-ACP dehydrogenase [Chloroflexi bacterium]|nr:acyl-CoA/acyl-ACP dehydrogenase [Chloroflexota bacterium]
MQSMQRAVINTPNGFASCASEPILLELSEVIAQHLRPNLQRIDAEGVYPKEFMHLVGTLGGFRQGCPTTLGGAGKGIKFTMQVMEEIAKECVSTAFIVWCQTVCSWYIQNSENDHLKQHVLPKIITGQALAGTGLSNPMKHFSGIENIHITATPYADGFILNGTVPWVSNVDTDHYFAVGAKIVETNDYLMAIVLGGSQGLSLGSGGHFIALEGSSTRSCILRNVFVDKDSILSSPCENFVQRIKPGFILSQTGFGLGLVSSCVELIKRSNKSKRHVNRFLDDQAEDIEADLYAAHHKIYALADEIDCGERDARPDLLKEVIQARLLTSQLVLRASQSAMLHAGASGYRLHSAVEKKLREAYFVAIVTPALKHLKKMLSDMQESPAV